MHRDERCHACMGVGMEHMHWSKLILKNSKKKKKSWE
jgi:hypothetical protein